MFVVPNPVDLIVSEDAVADAKGNAAADERVAVGKLAVNAPVEHSL